MFPALVMHVHCTVVNADKCRRSDDIITDNPSAFRPRFLGSAYSNN